MSTFASDPLLVRDAGDIRIRLLFRAIGQLGLPDEQDGQQLLGAGLVVGQQPDFLEQFVGQALRLVDDQRRDLVALLAVGQQSIELEQEPFEVAAFGLRPKATARNS